MNVCYDNETLQDFNKIWGKCLHEYIKRKTFDHVQEAGRLRICVENCDNLNNLRIYHFQL